MSIHKKTQEYLQQILQPGDYCVDGTIGNGHDTLFIAQIIGEGGKVFGFDIQQIAIERTLGALQEQQISPRCFELFCKSHHLLKETIPKHLHGKIKVAIFNLGYLPAADREIMTQPATTMVALRDSLEILCKNGQLFVTVYTKHDGGWEEWEVIQPWLGELSQENYSILYEMPKPLDRRAPKLIIITKLRQVCVDGSIHQESD